MTLFTRKRKEIGDTYDFDVITLRLASGERIKEWSYGEVTKPETINYRTQRSEKNGLFDEKIFGPEKDFECFCGKYKGIRYKGIVCDRCGVELTRSIVRRDRMGHIELASPVTHIWFLRSIPSRLAMLLDLPAADVEKVAYFAGYIIRRINVEERDRIIREIDAEYKTKVKSAPDEKQRDKLKELLTNAKKELELISPGKVISEAQYHKFSVRYGTMFEAGIGTEALVEIVKQIDLPKLHAELLESRLTASAPERPKITKRLALVSALISADVRPEWMFLNVLPVIPPALRPMVALEGGRHASSDVNDLYRRVINRNNRLKKLIDIHAPEVILRNEKRILQEAVDALLDNSIRHSGTTLASMNQAQRRPLKSLSDYLKGKQGYFRQNLLGKRVDYSGRSVIVVGPELKLDQCGLPKHMALELFRPFVIAKLLERELAFNIRGAGRLIEEGDPEVWAILEEIIEDKHVLLNRAPTLHRQGIQAFRPVLVEGNAIRVHPLVCPAFNADFDGDQMAVHVPLSKEAQLEAATIMSANKNILKPGNGSPVVATTMDIALGCYWMTRMVEGEKGEGKVFPSPNNAITAYDFGEVSFRAKIKVAITDSPKYANVEGELLETTVGRLLFNAILPKEYPYINDEMKKSSLQALVDRLIERYGLEQVPALVDKIKEFGFKYATYSGTTWGIDDLPIPAEKKGIIDKAKAHQQEIVEQFKNGLLSTDERKRISIEIWHKAKTDVEGLITKTLKPNGSVADLILSGARGSLGQMTQMAGMKGLMQNTKGETIEFPITASMKEGLSPIEYFVTTHGARKGLADTALKTARAGYLTRKLFDVAQDAIITEHDCKTKLGIPIGRKSASGIEIPFGKNIKGRTLAADVIADGKTLFDSNHVISAHDADVLEGTKSVDAVLVRSPMTCETRRGVCQLCYGADPTTNDLVDLGEAVGTMAAQAIGEPGTQLTMRTFHTGGTASVGGDITQGLPRVEEVFERRIPKNPAVISTCDGVVTEIKDSGKEKIIVVIPDLGEKAASKKDKAVEYSVHYRRMTLVKVGDPVVKGQFLTDGSADLAVLFKYGGREATQNYVISETSKIYELQGVTISRKHIEIIIKQMFSRRRIKNAGGTRFNVGDMVEDWELQEVNEAAAEAGKELAQGDLLLLGIAEVALSRKSFLSAASFQNTTKVLINSALRGSVDPLRGLKENVIIGRLIPAGTGFAGSKKHAAVRELQDKERERERIIEEAQIAEEMRRAAEEEGEERMPTIRNREED